jgi:transcriptional regulator with XRE-family HTH domain
VTLGETIRRARRAAKLTLCEVSSRAQISVSHLSRIESDRRSHPASEVALRRIARALGLNEDEICALGGHVPSDVARFIVRNPGAIGGLRAMMERR